MRLAVISDMHGNDVAFEAALADIDRSACDQIICLGDAIQGGPQPAEVTSRLRDRQIPVVMGNADAWMLAGGPIAESVSEERRHKLNAAREWSLSKLSTADVSYIESFQPTIAIDLGERKTLLCFHGSPKSFDDILMPDSPLDRFLEVLPCDDAQFFTGGHTHVQFIRHIGMGFHFNPGSAGAANRHNQNQEEPAMDRFAEYAILDVARDRLSLEFKRVPFRVDLLMSVYKDSGRPYADEAIASYSR